MRISRYLVAGISATAMLGLYGCSGSMDSGVSTASNSTEQAVNALGYIGSKKCIECHETSHPALVGDYLAGIHVVHGTGVTAASGESCLQCHDPIGDGPLIQNRVPAANVPAAGLAAVGCEGCHGNEAGHYRVAYPVAATCGQCHDTIHAMNPVNPEGENIYSDYLASKHGKGPTAAQTAAPCIKCHTDEGGRMYKDIHTAADLANVLPLEAASPIQCRTCHNAHNPDKLLLAATASESAQYNTCTNCHQRHDAQVGDLISHDVSWTRVISSTHYDNPATPCDSDPLTLSIIEGYNLDPTSDRVCLDCHNVHSADITINQQWARSGHGGRILSAKETAAAGQADNTSAEVNAVRAAGALDVDNAFAHYDWDSTTKLSAGVVVKDRADCQMCHTATGNKNFLTNQAAYNPSNNDFSYLAGWSKDALSGLVTPSGQNELLYCWSCHTDNSGTLRTPGAITLAYTVDGVKPALPDQGNSNVCINCHSGRGNMDSLVAPASVNPAGAAVAVSSSATKTHYLAAGATIFQAKTKIGYMYSSPANYADMSFFKHNTLGCAECHMSSNNSHSYGVVEKDGNGVITAITSTRCVKCHTGEHALFVGASLLGQVADIWDGSAAVPTTVTQAMVDAAVAELEHEAHGYHDALAALADALTSAGTPPQAAYPYFSGAATDQGHSGAIHNYSYLHHEPGAYAHNRYYAKRLIFDSIDWLTSGPAGSRSLDGSITLNPATYGAAIGWLGGDVNTGIIATRP